MGTIISLIATLFTALIALGAFAFWIWMLVECVTKEPSHGNDRLIWVLVIVLANTLGALLYFFVRRPVRIRDFGG